MHHKPNSYATADQLQKDFLQKILTDREKRKRLNGFKSSDYQKPKYNTPEYWNDYRAGLISEEEAGQDNASFEIRSKRAKDNYNKKASTLKRHLRPAPFESKQYSKPMATTAARDDRLTPQSKALLQVIVARTGEGALTDTCKTTLADIMSRSPRMIQRYLSELVKFGYIRTQIKKSRSSGLYVGLRIWITNTVLPYFKDKDRKYDPVDLGQTLGNPDKTDMTLINTKHTINRTIGAEKPPWSDKFSYGL